MGQKLMPVLLLALVGCQGAVCVSMARAQSDGVSDGLVKIGLILDLSGAYSDITGEGTVTAVRMAIEDFGGKVLGNPIELVAADHQNKPDIAANRAREWFDRERVDALMDVTASAPALAVVEVAKQKNKLVVFNSAATTRLTNDACSPTTITYAYDTYALSSVIGNAVAAQGANTWYFLTTDSAFGYSLEEDASKILRARGGKVMGSVRHPINAPDFSSFMLQAQASGAKVIVLANAGGDTSNAIKAAKEFNVTRDGKQQLAGLLIFINTVHSLGLELTQGLLLSEGFYWDMNEQTRAWSKRFFERTKKMPNMSQAGSYSATRHYLAAVRSAGTDETAAVLKKMRETPIQDFFAANGYIREDGRMVHDMYLFQVKKPSESKGPWDYYTLRTVIPAEQAVQSLAQSTCPIIKNRR
jgi:branched-chain amino acid transport system substrate-binding protein